MAPQSGGSIPWAPPTAPMRAAPPRLDHISPQASNISRVQQDHAMHSTVSSTAQIPQPGFQHTQSLPPQQQIQRIQQAQRPQQTQQNNHQQRRQHQIQRNGPNRHATVPTARPPHPAPRRAQTPKFSGADLEVAQRWSNRVVSSNPTGGAMAQPRQSPRDFISLHIRNPQLVQEWEASGLSHLQISYQLQWYIMIAQWLQSETVSDVLALRNTKPYHIFDERNVFKATGGAPPPGYIPSNMRFLSTDASQPQPPYVEGQRDHELVQFRRSFEPLPIGTTLTQILEKYPNHLKDEYLDYFLQHRVSAEDMYRCLGEEAYQQMKAAGYMDRRPDHEHEFLLERLRQRDAALISVIQTYNPKDSLQEVLAKQDAFLETSVKVFQLGDLVYRRDIAPAPVLARPVAQVTTLSSQHGYGTSAKGPINITDDEEHEAVPASTVQIRQAHPTTDVTTSIPASAPAPPKPTLEQLIQKRTARRGEVDPEELQKFTIAPNEIASLKAAVATCNDEEVLAQLLIRRFIVKLPEILTLKAQDADAQYWADGFKKALLEYGVSLPLDRKHDIANWKREAVGALFVAMQDRRKEYDDAVAAVLPVPQPVPSPIPDESDGDSNTNVVAEAPIVEKEVEVSPEVLQQAASSVPKQVLGKRKLGETQSEVEQTVADSQPVPKKPKTGSFETKSVLGKRKLSDFRSDCHASSTTRSEPPQKSHKPKPTVLKLPNPDRVLAEKARLESIFSLETANTLSQSPLWYFIWPRDAAKARNAQKYYFKLLRSLIREQREEIAYLVGRPGSIAQEKGIKQAEFDDNLEVIQDQAWKGVTPPGEKPVTGPLNLDRLARQLLQFAQEYLERNTTVVDLLSSEDKEGNFAVNIHLVQIKYHKQISVSLATGVIGFVCGTDIAARFTPDFMWNEKSVYDYMADYVENLSHEPGYKLGEASTEVARLNPYFLAFNAMIEERVPNLDTNAGCQTMQYYILLWRIYLDMRKEQIMPQLWKLVDDALVQANNSVREHSNYIFREGPARRARLEAKGYRFDAEGNVISRGEDSAAHKHSDENTEEDADGNVQENAPTPAARTPRTRKRKQGEIGDEQDPIPGNKRRKQLDVEEEEDVVQTDSDEETGDEDNSEDEEVVASTSRGRPVARNGRKSNKRKARVASDDEDDEDYIPGPRRKRARK
jgi:hypothetical protein